jgi:predicted dienelactone hydrolase
MNTTDSVGYCALEVPDQSLGLSFPLAVLYPTRAPAKSEALDQYTLEVALDAALSPGLFPLVLISHGTGSSPWVYRNLACFLAQNGFVVGLPTHIFNNRDDNAWAGTPQNFSTRPHHLQLAINSLFADPRFAVRLQPDSVALIGHSLGGYTALALAGGQPTTLPRESPDGETRRIPTAHDTRIKALVLLAPATPWFMAEGTLRQVKVSILLVEAEKDEHTSSQHGQAVLRGIPDPGRVEHRVIENAGHFSFLSPFPAARISPTFLPSQDPPGFDRVGFHKELHAEVLTFLIKHL